AWWAIATTSWSLEATGCFRSSAAGQPWGLSTHRQRLPFRLEDFAATAEEFGQLPALAATPPPLPERLQVLWPELEPMPLSPPFRSPAVEQRFGDLSIR